MWPSGPTRVLCCVNRARQENGMTTTHGLVPRTVGILIFPDVEILDFCGPFQVYSRAALPPERDDAPERWLFTVVAVAESPDPFACRGGLRVHPDATLR